MSHCLTGDTPLRASPLTAWERGHPGRFLSRQDAGTPRCQRTSKHSCLLAGELGVEAEEAEGRKGCGEKKKNTDFGEDTTGRDAAKDECQISLHRPGCRRAAAEGFQDRGNTFEGPHTAAEHAEDATDPRTQGDGLLGGAEHSPHTE